MSIYVKPCFQCRQDGRPKKDQRRRKACADWKWIAIAPPSMGRRSLGVYETKDQASAAYQEAIVNHRRGTDLPPTTLTVSGVLERYLRDGTAELSVTTLHRYRELWTIHGSVLGKYRIADLKVAHVTALYSKLQQEPREKRKVLGPRTVLHLHRVLHRAFEWAVNEEMLGANIFARVRTPKVGDTEARALSLAEAAAFFEAAAQSKFEAFFLIAAMTGARRGELCALKWEAVDLDSGVVTIRASLAATRATKTERALGSNTTVLKCTKTGKSRRVPLDPDAIVALRRVKAAQAAAQLAAAPGTFQNNGFVFTDSIGRPVKLDAPTKAFREVAGAAKLPAELTLHSLRHSFASWSLANGGDIAAVQRVMGHSVPSTTLNLYSHVVAGGRERAVTAASDTLRRVQAGAAVGKK